MFSSLISPKAAFGDLEGVKSVRVPAWPRGAKLVGGTSGEDGIARSSPLQRWVMLL